MHVRQFWLVLLLRFLRLATFQKRPNFPFGAWTIVHGHQKILIDRNWLKKYMLVGTDVTCMYASFGGCGLFSFGDMVTFQKRPNFPFEHGQ